MTPGDELLTPTETAALLKVRAQTLATWRSAHRYDLPFVRVGNKAIRYRLSDVNAWIDRQVVGATTGAATAFFPLARRFRLPRRRTAFGSAAAAGAAAGAAALPGLARARLSSAHRKSLPRTSFSKGRRASTSIRNASNSSAC